jgi:outer membrane receptor protein involved in Fe transport
VRRARSLCFGTALVMLALPLSGQNYAGRLGGKVTRDGRPVAGVTVTVTSPQQQGAKETVTSESGDYHFPSLPPGDYTVVFSGAESEPLTHELYVAAAQSVRLDAELTAVATETIVVTTDTPDEAVISQGSQAATTMPQRLVNDLPVGRTLNQIVALTPGVLTTGPTKSEATGLGNLTISGAPTYENLFLLNGVVLNENIRGQALDLYIEDAIQETTATTGAISAEYGRFSGGVVNAVTKSGGNELSGSFRTSFSNQKWEERTALTTVQTDDVVPTFEATFGGPLLRDRLWFFLAGRDRESSRTGTTDARTSLSFPIANDQQRYEGKLTATLTPRHTLFATYSQIDNEELGNFFTGAPILDLASVVNRETPQRLSSANYAGALTNNLLLTVQLSRREFTFVDAGATSRDLVAGTLVIADALGGARYNSPTFCGVCRPEERDNENVLGKLSYFLSSERLGSHDLVAGYDRFTDIRAADNHQSGSDYRIIGTSAIIRGGEVFPVWDNDTSTAIVFNPILQESRGTDFTTLSYYVNDQWRLNDRLTLNLGLRYDQNEGVNAAGASIAEDSYLSPRIAASLAPRRDGRFLLHASYGQYVAALANSIADASSSAGTPATIAWDYLGPAINTDSNATTLLTTHEALRILFDWFGAAGGFDGRLVPFFTNIPGGTTRMEGSLDSPNVTEYTLGVSAQLGTRGSFRADLVQREWGNFYSDRIDLGTGRVQTPNGPADLALVRNDDELFERDYLGLHTAFRYRAMDSLDLGGSWTLSRSEGNFEGETSASGPVRGTLGRYPEYRDLRWASDSGALSIDQRHRVVIYGLYRLLAGDRHSLSIGAVQSYFSGLAYGAAGTISLLRTPGVASSNYVANPGYVQPPQTATYFFSDRDAFRTPEVFRTDLSLNYGLGLGRYQIFFDGEVINLLDEERVDTTSVNVFDTTILTANNDRTLQRFNPFSETPVEGVHWRKGPRFGQPTNTNAFQQPRTFRFSVGLRF